MVEAAKSKKGRRQKKINELNVSDPGEEDSELEQPTPSKRKPGNRLVDSSDEEEEDVKGRSRRKRVMDSVGSSSSAAEEEKEGQGRSGRATRGQVSSATKRKIKRQGEPPG